MDSKPFHPVCRTPAGLFVPVPVDPTGRRGPTRGQASGPLWRRVAHDRYVPAHVDGSVPEQRIIEAAAHLPADGAVTGWGGLRLLHAAYFDGRGRSGTERHDVLLNAGSRTSRRKHPGIAWSYEPLAPGEVWHFLGVPLVVPCRATFDELRRPGSGREAVVALDMAMAASVVTPEALAAYLEDRASWRRAGQVRDALALAQRGSRSPGESRTRLEWVDAGLPRPLLNREIFTLTGQFVCEADLLDVEAGMVVEYDGDPHAETRRRSRDADRQEQCRRVGLEYCTITAPDLYAPRLVRERFLSARARALFLPPELRRWTLEPPPGWEPLVVTGEVSYDVTHPPRP